MELWGGIRKGLKRGFGFQKKGGAKTKCQSRL